MLLYGAGAEWRGQMRVRSVHLQALRVLHEGVSLWSVPLRSLPRLRKGDGRRSGGGRRRTSRCRREDRSISGTRSSQALRSISLTVSAFTFQVRIPFTLALLSWQLQLSNLRIAIANPSNLSRWNFKIQSSRLKLSACSQNKASPGFCSFPHSTITANCK